MEILSNVSTDPYSDLIVNDLLSYEAALEKDFPTAASALAEGARRVHAARVAQEQRETARRAANDILGESLAIVGENVSTSAVIPNVMYQGRPATVHLPAGGTYDRSRYGSSTQARVLIVDPNNKHILADIHVLRPHEGEAIRLQTTDYAYDDTHTPDYSRYETRKDPDGQSVMDISAAAKVIPELPAIAEALRQASRETPLLGVAGVLAYTC